jgi:excisionase family DNA binding protein
MVALVALSRYHKRMGNAVFFEDMTDEVKDAASVIAREVAPSTLATRGLVLDALTSQPELRDLVAAVAERLVRDIAAGRHPVYVTAEDDVSPAEAARILGVSRQFVDRLLASGRLAFAHKPGSTHRTIRVAAIEQFANERNRRRTNTDKAIDALLDGGMEY